jgi:hypothetical protein
VDAVEILFTAAVGALSGGVVGGAISEWRAQAAEARAVQRERATTVRNRQFAAIEETRLDYAAANEAALSLAAGRPTNTKYYPNAQIWLINDPALLIETADVRHELISRGGRGISDDDARRLGVLLGRVSTALSRQEERVLDGQPVAYPTRDEAEAVLQRVSRVHGIDPRVVDELFGRTPRPPGNA